MIVEMEGPMSQSSILFWPQIPLHQQTLDKANVSTDTFTTMFSYVGQSMTSKILFAGTKSKDHTIVNFEQFHFL